MTKTTITRNADESDVQLMERAAVALRRRAHRGCYADAGFGPLCVKCASFGTVEGNTVEIRVAAECYNCGK